MKTLQTMKYALPFKMALLSVFFVLTFLFSVTQVQAATPSIVWYSNPQESLCATATAEDIADPSSVPGRYGPGYYLSEGCPSYNWENDTCSGGYQYEVCAPAGNDVFNSNGAVASFAASMDQETYTPGERGTVNLIGGLGSYGGSDFAKAVIFFTPDFFNIRSIVCWFLSCAVTRRVDVSVTVPRIDGYSATDDGECDNPSPGDPLGYGIPYQASRYFGDAGCTVNWTAYQSSKSFSEIGSLYKQVTFKAPTSPGNYSIDLVGCHEKFGGFCGSVFLNFQVTAAPSPPPPTINVRF